MSVRRTTEKEGVYFITFNCYKQFPLIDIVNGYEVVYQQFDYLKKCGHHIIGYVIMPNHMHAVIAFRDTGKTISAIIGNIKRLIAYEIVRRLQERGEKQILSVLAAGISTTNSKRGNLYEVFEPSFNITRIDTYTCMEQKLHYMHTNPCRGKWQLAIHLQAYPHSSAKYYLTGQQGIYEVLDYMQLEDKDLTIGQFLE